MRAWSTLLWTFLLGFSSAEAHRRHLRHHHAHEHVTSIMRHRLHHEHEGRRKHGHRGHGIHLKEDEITMQGALARMPEKARSAFQEATKTKNADEAMKQLGRVYERARIDEDTLEIACKDMKEELAQEVKGARVSLMIAESQLTRTTDRMQDMQSKLDRSLAEMESIRQQYSAHKALCDKNAKQTNIQLGILMKDLPAAKAFVAEATKGCGAAGGTPPALVDCSLPDGSNVVTFEDDAVRAKVAALSASAEWFMSLNLKRAVYGHKKTSFIQLHSSASLQDLHDPNTTPSAPLRLLQANSTSGALPAGLCKSSPKPVCEAFGDMMVTFLGNIEDSMDDLRERAQLEDDHCVHSLETYDGQIREMKQWADDTNVMFANAAAESEDLEKDRKTKRELLRDLHEKVDQKLGECGRQIEAAESMMCGAKKLREELKVIEAKTAEPFIGDCEVTEWIRGPCTAACGGGIQNLTREIISAPKTNPKCPPLMMTRKCNEKPCAVDCVMERWEEWSDCSRACGGGAKARHRSVIQEPSDGGVPCGETTQEQLCNVEPCDLDCTLTEWSEWSTCSKSCMKGHKTKYRHVLHAPVGDGACPAETSPDRRTLEPCNSVECKPAEPTCASKVDVVLVLDGSGSVTTEGWTKTAAFAKLVVGKIKFGEEHAKVGLVQYSTEAKMFQALTATSGDVETQIGGMAWLKGSTNTAEALVVAREVFLTGRKDAQSVAVVITDGMPSSKYLTSTAVARIKDQGVRVVFVAVGSSVNQRVLAHWASWPSHENVITATGFDQLDAAKVTELVSTICPVLEK